MTLSPAKRRLLSIFDEQRRTGRLIDSSSRVSEQIQILGRVHPGKEILLLPSKQTFVKGPDGKLRLRFIPARAQLAKPVFLLNEPATAVVTVEEIASDGCHSTKWPTWCLSGGTWHDDHLVHYWRSRGVSRNSPHRRIAGMVSPSDGWSAIRPSVGSVFRDEHERAFVITSLGREKTGVLQIKGDIDCTYRAINLVSVTVMRKGAVPRGALRFLGKLPLKSTIRELAAIAGSGKSHGTNQLHAD